MEKSAETQYSGILFGSKVKVRIILRREDHIDLTLEMDETAELLAFYCTRIDQLTMQPFCPYSSDVLRRAAKAAAAAIVLGDMNKDIVMQL